MAKETFHKADSKYGRKHIWERLRNGYEDNVMVNEMPQELKDKGVEENYLVRHNLMVLDSFKKKKDAINYAKQYMQTEKLKRVI